MKPIAELIKMCEVATPFYDKAIAEEMFTFRDQFNPAFVPILKGYALKNERSRCERERI